jgi:hypothetical protein
MSQPLQAAVPIPRIVSVDVGSPSSIVTGTISAMVQDNPKLLTLSGGRLEEFGWEASGNTITLSPLSSQQQPVLYQFSFQFNDNFQLAGNGLQISTSPSTGSFAACLVNSPLDLINNVASGNVTLNLGLVVEDPVNNITLTFGDPTILFDPPQT